MKTKKIKNKKDEEPGLIHYLIVICIIFSICFFIYLGNSIYNEKKDKEEFDKREIDLENRFKYKYIEFNGVVMNMEFFTTFDKLYEYNHNVNVNKEDINYFKDKARFVVINYTQEERDNKDGYQVLKATSRVLQYLDLVFNYEFNENDFSGNYYPTFTCENSTKDFPIILFNTKAQVNEVKFLKENYCLEFLSKSPKDMVRVSDSFFLKMATTNSKTFD